MVPITDLSHHTLVLEYPCQWSYRLVARDRVQILQAIEAVLGERPHSLRPSNTSRSGKYISMNLELLVYNEEERGFLYENLKAHPAITMVL